MATVVGNRVVVDKAAKASSPAYDMSEWYDSRFYKLDLVSTHLCLFPWDGLHGTGVRANLDGAMALPDDALAHHGPDPGDYTVLQPLGRAVEQAKPGDPG